MITLGQRLGELRRRAFVGRDDEIALFRRTRSGVIFVHGSGGVGKSALLDRFAEIATETGRELLRVDARHLTLGPDRLPEPAGDRPAVVLIDTYELLEPVDDQVRERYLPSLPADTLVVLAGRRPPGVRWRADPAWRELVHIVPLGNLPAADGLRYLAAQDVPEDSRDRLLRIGHGHPLTLSMLVDAVRRGAETGTLADLPDVVGALLAQLVDEAPSPRHRAALEVCAHVPATTEDLLRAVTGGDAGELFGWLRTLPFVEEGPHGLYPHDVVRDALDADLRWRDPDRYAELDRMLSAAILTRIRATADRRARLQLIVDHIVVAGARSRIETCRTPPPVMRAYVDDLRDGDRAPIAAMTARWQGAEQAALAVSWMDRDPAAFHVFRTPAGEPRGYAACLDLTVDRGGDPGAEAMWRYVRETAPPRDGERVRAWRFYLDRDHGQLPSPSVTLFAACQTLDILTAENVAWTLVGAYADPDRWDATLSNLGFWQAGSYAVGATGYPVYAHDWRRTGVPEWMGQVQARQAGASTPRTSADAGDTVLARPEFDDAVRAALRDLDRLDGNPLLRSRLVRGAGPDPAVALRGLIEAATSTLPDALAALVDRTFLHPVTTQERVAETLHLSFNTYRRHRDRAVARIADRLWEREILSS
ncbi:hypothetical protein J2S43_004277 [Catenuloplanes nepalensis]|uniref:Orc1-like AAA ATPase domain-containing protein n=1 Tax=Catenuloplanes nepalensis TaxID=587533 RepID=A0ABT9MWK9_9ACTN|nr:ATP-binding protein [Catenuloplanes nepalensis]MDP9795765.1 hypothetical protein [Catenuloplanes nepalensis]